MRNQERSERSIRYTQSTTPIRYQRGMSRRDFLKKIGIIGGASVTALGLAAWSRFGVPEALKELANNGETDYQKKAAEILASSNKRTVNNLKIRRIENDGEIIPAKLRDKPRVEIPYDKPDISAGKIIGHLKEGEEIHLAIPVWGNDPYLPQDKNRRSIWLAFVDPYNKKRIVFTDASNVEPILDPYSVEPYELK